MMSSTKPHLLLDMDGSTYDFQKPLLQLIKKSITLPKTFIEQMEDTTKWTKISLWDLFDGTQQERDLIKSIVEPLYQNVEFFESLEPYPWMVDTVHDLKKDFHIEFCTKPSKKPCGSESVKRASIIKYFWNEFSTMIHMSHDKTAVRGDLLVDDNADIHGHYNIEGRKPDWKQLLVDQPHNQESNLPRLYTDRLDLWKWQLQEILLQTT